MIITCEHEFEYNWIQFECSLLQFGNKATSSEISYAACDFCLLRGSWLGHRKNSTGTDSVSNIRANAN